MGFVWPVDEGHLTPDFRRARTFPEEARLWVRRPHRGEVAGSSGPGPGRLPRIGVRHLPDSSGMLAGRLACLARRSAPERLVRRIQPTALLPRPPRRCAPSPDMVC